MRRIEAENCRLEDSLNQKIIADKDKIIHNLELEKRGFQTIMVDYNKQLTNSGVDLRLSNQKVKSRGVIIIGLIGFSLVELLIITFK